MTRFALLTSIAATALMLVAAPSGRPGPFGPGVATAAQDPVISVHEVRGKYVVSATFTVPGTPAAARAVLTDYANIPRFMPDVRSSVVLERHDGRIRVAQEATPKFMWFSRDISLVLDVDEGPEVIRFEDTAHTSFTRYEGSWTIAALDGQTQLTYALTAHPAFSVPGFMLKKLLKRDATAMVGRLRAEILTRSAE
jgi:hypothetical protein